MAKITKIIKTLLPKDLGSLGNLEETKSAGALVPLKKQEFVPSRREFLKRAGSTVAQTALPRGVLTTLIEKGLEQEPIIGPPGEIKSFGGTVFKSFDQMMNFLKDLWEVRTGDPISKKELLEKDMAEYLNYFENNDTYHQSPEAFSKGANIEVLDTIEYDETEDGRELTKAVADVKKKYFGDKTVDYGGVAGDDITTEAFRIEHGPDAPENEEDAIIEWIKSKGIEETPYYKKLKSFRNITFDDKLEWIREQVKKKK